MDKKIKVLLIPPLYGGSLPITYYCADALKELGHHVEIFNAPPFLEAYGALNSLKISQSRLNSLEQNLIQLISQAIYALVESFQPNLVLAMAQAPLNRNTLKKFQHDGVKTAMWFMEDYKVFQYWQTLAPYYDYFFIIQQEEFLEKLAKIGVQNAYYLPMAAMPNFHEKIELSPDEMSYYGADIAFMGAGYPNRQIAFRSLIKYNFKIWGSEWDHDDLLKKYLQNEGKRISPEESIKIYNATKINLNLHSSINAKELISNGDFVNPRTFELASMQAFQLVDHRAFLAQHFQADTLNNITENTEIAVFNDMEGLHESIGFYLKNPEKRIQIAQNAQRRIQKEHTYTQRMKTLLDYIDKTSGFLVDEQVGMRLPENLSPAVKKEIEELLNKLNLSASDSFDNVLTAIKQKNSELTEIETALLFLEEWKKFYN